MQVDPVKFTLTAPGTERLKLKYEELLSNIGFKFNLRRYTVAAAAALRDELRLAVGHGRAVQVNPMKPKLKPPGTERLKLQCDTLLSTSAFKTNLRRYSTGARRGRCSASEGAAGGCSGRVAGGCSARGAAGGCSGRRRWPT